MTLEATKGGIEIFFFFFLRRDWWIFSRAFCVMVWMGLRMGSRNVPESSLRGRFSGYWLAAWCFYLAMRENKLHNWDSFAEGMENQSIREGSANGREIKTWRGSLRDYQFRLLSCYRENLQADARHGNLISIELTAEWRNIHSSGRAVERSWRRP